MSVLLIVILVVVVLVLLWFIGVYNSLVSLKNKVKNQFSQIDVQLKKRYDLIPNLVETVKGYTKHETETLEKVMEARNGYASAKTDSEKVESANELSKQVTKLFALAEAYPDLKANSNFLSLQNDLKEIEDKISYARQFYNDSVLSYNNKVQMVPSNIVANMTGFTKAAFFEADEKDKEKPEVKFE